MSSFCPHGQKRRTLPTCFAVHRRFSGGGRYWVGDDGDGVEAHQGTAVRRTSRLRVVLAGDRLGGLQWVRSRCVRTSSRTDTTGGAQSQTEPQAAEARQWRMARHAVVIAGGGPAGLMLGAELALAQVDVVIVERRATPDPGRSRAGVCTRAPSRCSISAVSPTGLSRRGRRGRSRDSAGSRWISAISRPAATMGSPCRRLRPSACWLPGSKSSGCRSRANVR